MALGIRDHAEQQSRLGIVDVLVVNFLTLSMAVYEYSELHFIFIFYSALFS